MTGIPAGAAAPILLLLVVMSTDVWVFFDAAAQADQGTPVMFSTDFLTVDSPVTWYLACLLLWILFFPLYVMSRNRVGPGRP